MDFSKLTLGDLLGHEDNGIRRTANSILKQLNKIQDWKIELNTREPIEDEDYKSE